MHIVKYIVIVGNEIKRATLNALNFCMCLHSNYNLITMYSHSKCARSIVFVNTKSPSYSRCTVYMHIIIEVKNNRNIQVYKSHYSISHWQTEKFRLFQYIKYYAICCSMLCNNVASQYLMNLTHLWQFTHSFHSFILLQHIHLNWKQLNYVLFQFQSQSILFALRYQCNLFWFCFLKEKKRRRRWKEK